MALEEAEKSYKMWEHEREHMEKHRHHHRHHDHHHDGHHHRHHRHHHRGDRSYSRDYYVADEIPLDEVEPVEYIIKHDEKKHKALKRAKKYAKKLIEDPDAR